MKNPLIPARIEPATFRFVAQRLNHCATAVPIKTFRIIKVAPTCFGLHNTSSGSYNLCLAKITFLVPLAVAP